MVFKDKMCHLFRKIRLKVADQAMEFWERKIVLVLSGLAPTEKKWAKNYLSINPFGYSPIQLEELLKLFDDLNALIQSREKLEGPQFDAIKHLFGKKYYTLKPEKYFSYLYKCVKEAMVILYLRREKSHKNQAFISWLESRTKLAGLLGKEVSLHLKHAPRSSQDIYFKYQFLLSKVRHTLLTKKRQVEPGLKNANAYLHAYFDLQKAKLDCALLNQYQVFGNNAASLDNQGKPQIPLLSLFVLARKILMAADPSSEMPSFLDLIEKEKANFPEIELHEAIICVSNRLIRGVNEGKVEFRMPALMFYEHLQEKKLIYYSGKVHVWHFKNYLFLLCTMGKVEKATVFLSECKEQGLIDELDCGIVFAEGMFAFFTGNFAKAKVRFQNVFNLKRDMFYDFNSRAYLLKTYYHLQEFDLLENFLETNRRFFDRKKGVSNIHRVNYQKFIRYFRKFYSRVMNPKSRKQKLEKLHQELIAMDRSFSLDWILRQVEQWSSQ